MACKGVEALNSGAAVRLNRVCWRYGQSAPVVNEFSLAVEPGEMVALLGESGCGKSTVLRLIAGLLQPMAGTIEVDGQIVNSIPAEKRRTALVFQKPLLFPHLSVAENVAFSLRLKRAGTDAIRDRVREALALVRLEGFEMRRAHELSGGQEQRVSLARALVSEPAILLLDEPFAALDENLRGGMRTLVRGIQRTLGLTALFVTHDRVEAAAMAHRIAFMTGGRVAQHDSLRRFYEAPASAETARFFGFQTLTADVNDGIATTAFGWCGSRPGASSKALVCLRPDAFSITTRGQPNAAVESSIDLGDRILTTVRSTSSGEVIEVLHDPPVLDGGTPVAVGFDSSRAKIFTSND